ncbi:terpenoid synthase [Sistotremastrum niveocremeum HHB9708]|uniref:Terpene synthase n=1 Tax=Sistotremastrum niveocremeum HHB9708 TaxID=1314777 RepID=A0A164Z0R6_9AGAM|nr:terpenoid synthase [Sistotremastrum niveocremeum HHB9708]
MSSTAVQFILPNLMSTWPWKGNKLNPFYEEATAESEAWFSSFKPFSPKALEAFFGCRPSMLAGYAYPDFTRDQMRAACDFIFLLFMIDEYSDVEDEAGAARIRDIATSGMKNPHDPRPDGENFLGEMCRQYALRSLEVSTPITHNRFVKMFEDYTQAVVIEARDRQFNIQRNLEDYMSLRRGTSALKTVYTLTQFDLNIPDYVYNHEVIQKLQDGAVDMIGLQDVWSYNVEQHHGNAGHNLITIIMNELDLSLDDTLLWVENFERETAAGFIKNIENVPSWGPEIDAQVARFINGMGTWVAGNESWSFGCSRYFGTRGKEIAKSRVVTLLPKRMETRVASLVDVRE